MAVDFAEFWEIWPRKVSRKPAKAKWEKLSEAEQKAAMADVAKRNRFKAWSPDKKKIPHAQTYLNQERWADEWEDELKSERDNLPNTGPFLPPIREPEVQMPWEEKLLNRVGRSYILLARGLPEIQTFLNIKREIVATAVPAFREDLNDGLAERSDIAKDLVGLFLTRLDAAYQRKLKPVIW